MANYHVCFIDGFSSRAVQLLYDDTDVWYYVKKKYKLK